MFSPCENLAGFIRTRPPLVIFTLCMMLFGLVLVSLSFYIQSGKIRNPDVSTDWNSFLDNFAELELCITGNATSDISGTSPPTTIRSSVKPNSSSGHLGKQQKTTPSYDLKNYAIQMVLQIKPTIDFLQIPHNITHLSGQIKGTQIGFQDDRADEEILVTADLPFNWSSLSCSQGVSCQSVSIKTCVHFVAESKMFPSSNEPDICTNLNETGVMHNARFLAYRSKHQDQKFYCRSRPIINLKHDFDSSLAVWLSTHDKSVINLHLMHTSYFLFVMVIMLFCYALIRGKPHTSKLTQTEKPLVSPTQL